MSGKTIPPGILHPREPDTCAFAEHEDGHTKMAAFKIPGPTATVFMGVLAGRGDCRKFQHRSRSIASIAHSQGDRAPGRPRSTGVHDRRPSVPTKSICIARAFYAYTSLGRHSSERIRRLIAQDAALARKAGDASEFENTLVSIVKMAYKLTTARAARSQTDIMGGQIIVNHNFGGTENGKTRRADPGALCMAPRWRGGARCRAYDIECDPCRYPNCVFRDHLENTLRLREFKPETRVS